MGFPGVSDGKEATCNAGDLVSIHGLGRCLEEDMATYSSILAWRIPMDRGATVHGVTKSRNNLMIKHSIAQHKLSYIMVYLTSINNISEGYLVK